MQNSVTHSSYSKEDLISVGSSHSRWTTRDKLFGSVIIFLAFLILIGITACIYTCSASKHQQHEENRDLNEEVQNPTLRTITSNSASGKTSVTTLSSVDKPSITKQPLPDNPYDLSAVSLLHQVLTIAPNFHFLNCESGATNVYQAVALVAGRNFTGEVSTKKNTAKEYAAQRAASKLFDLKEYPNPEEPLRPCNSKAI